MAIADTVAGAKSGEGRLPPIEVDSKLKQTAVGDLITESMLFDRTDG